MIGRGYSDIYEKEYIRKDGTIFPVELRVALIRGESGKPAGMWALIRDISVRKIIEQTLRDSEARYRELLENSIPFKPFIEVDVPEPATLCLAAVGAALLAGFARRRRQ